MFSMTLRKRHARLLRGLLERVQIHHHHVDGLRSHAPRPLPGAPGSRGHAGCRRALSGAASSRGHPASPESRSGRRCPGPQARLRAKLAPFRRSRPVPRHAAASARANSTMPDLSVTLSEDAPNWLHVAPLWNGIKINFNVCVTPASSLAAITDDLMIERNATNSFCAVCRRLPLCSCLAPDSLYQAEPRSYGRVRSEQLE